MTATVADASALPPEPVQSIVYVVVAVGDTLFVPLTASVPVQPPLAVHEEALVLDQVKVVDSPDVIDAVAAFNFAVGAGGGAAELTVIFVAD